MYYCRRKSHLNRLQHTHSAVAHAVVAAARFLTIFSDVCNLRWLKVRERIEHKAISTTYKLLQSSPCYLRELITVQ